MSLPSRAWKRGHPAAGSPYNDYTLNVKIAGYGDMSFPARLTTVLQDYDGRWLLEHFHLSVAASSQEEGQSF